MQGGGGGVKREREIAVVHLAMDYTIVRGGTATGRVVSQYDPHPPNFAEKKH